jgi:hypothetical protein
MFHRHQVIYHHLREETLQLVNYHHLREMFRLQHQLQLHQHQKKEHQLMLQMTLM